VGVTAAEVTDRAALERLIERYNAAWNGHDLDAIVALHAPGMVFENHTACERAEGDAVRDHIGQIFENWPDIAFRARRIHYHQGLVVNEWTATATERGSGRRLEWDGVDLFELEGDLINRKGVYSGSARPRVLSG
jgi:ketosteroid isomerase-like protein